MSTMLRGLQEPRVGQFLRVSTTFNSTDPLVPQNGEVQFIKGRRAYVLETKWVGRNAYVFLSFHTPFKTDGTRDESKTFMWNGFNYCRWVKYREVVKNFSLLAQ